MTVGKLSERVIRILGQNPGKFTLQGTNTYIIGKTNPFILVDTGEGNDTYTPHLEETLREAIDTSRPVISDIVLTHRHHDHTHGLPSVLNLIRRLWGERIGFCPPRIHKYLPPQSSPDDTLKSLLDHLPTDLFSPVLETGAVIHQLQTRQILHGVDASLEVLHTPGHTIDSICLYLPEEKALFAADTVLGQGTAVFEDLTAYITSLRSLLLFRNQLGKEFMTLYPGHGPVVKDGPTHISSYIKHRLERENQIVEILSSSLSSGDAWTLEALVANIYAQYPESLWEPAARGVHLHLLKLERENRVEQLEEGCSSKWVLKSKS